MTWPALSLLSLGLGLGACKGDDVVADGTADGTADTTGDGDGDGGPLAGITV
jgi:hypothetical protein